MTLAVEAPYKPNQSINQSTTQEGNTDEDRTRIHLSAAQEG